MSHFKAEMHQIRFPASVRSFFRLSLTWGLTLSGEWLLLMVICQVPLFLATRSRFDLRPSLPGAVLTSLWTTTVWRCTSRRKVKVPQSTTTSDGESLDRPAMQLVLLWIHHHYWIFIV